MKYPNVIVFDDDKTFTKQFSTILTEDGFVVMETNSLKSLIALLDDEETIRKTSAFIFDLAQNNTEEQTGKNFTVTDRIKENFNKWRIPIFIHSGFAETYSDFDNCGTVWKKEKSGSSVDEICKIINKLNFSGFNETFGQGGNLETTFLVDLHRTFTEQFRENDIEKIIDSVSQIEEKEFKSRVESIFKRIAVKALMSELISPVVSDGETVNAIEHYYRRISKVDFWTGDILSKNDNMELIIILTPRCNVASKKTEALLVCLIEKDFPGDDKKDKIKRALTDNPDFSGHAYRFLPPCAFFVGGKVNIASHKTISKEQLLNEYTRIVTLSDDLTNEILGKFGSYFLRTGINTINLSELTLYLDSLKEPAK